jgi:hypothetical protein
MRALLAAGLLVAPSLASAHIHLTFPTPRTDSQVGDQKTAHCGTVNWVRADHADRTTVLPPGATITVTWLETINHPGYYRIAFQPDGEVFGIPAESNGPTGNGQPSNFPTEDRTGMTDPANGSIVLADRIADGTLSLEVTLPNMECTNCTLQLIQVMTDKPPYTPNPSGNDLYYKCADITLSAGAPDPDPNPGNDAGPDPDPGGGGGGAGGGCSVGGGAGLLAALALLGLRRRRARAS